MACIDIDSLAQYERDAKEGRADALYNLGLAYSTGQGVGVDLIARPITTDRRRSTRCRIEPARIIGSSVRSSCPMIPRR